MRLTSLLFISMFPVFSEYPPRFSVYLCALLGDSTEWSLFFLRDIFGILTGYLWVVGRSSFLLLLLVQEDGLCTVGTHADDCDGSLQLCLQILDV